MAEEAMNEADAQAVLSAANAKLAAQAHWPWSRHFAYAAIVAGMAASQAADPPISTAFVSACVCALAAVVASDRAKRGVWINGWRGARWVTALSLVVGISGMFVSLWLHRELHLVWPSFVVSAVVLVICLLLSKLWEQVYRRELERGR